MRAYIARRCASAAAAHRLCLPRTSFARRGHPRDLDVHVSASSAALHPRMSDAQSSISDPPRFVIHDGPPFANGRLHIGHALNKFVKDCILRFHASIGSVASLRPAWDCHGLPIELRAIKENMHTVLPINCTSDASSPHGAQMQPGNQSVIADTTPSATEMKNQELTNNVENLCTNHSARLSISSTLAACRAFADEAVREQAQQAQRWGIMADYASAIRTMDPEYEYRQLLVLAAAVRQGLVFAEKRPTHWSPSSRTALADAELEYATVQDTACFVAYPLANSDLRLLAWTTTPWTLTANQAVAYSPKMQYVTVEHGTHRYVVARERLDFVQQHLTGARVVCDYRIANNQMYTNPLTSTTSPLIASDHVTAESGTALVHIAPAYGEEDYGLWTKHTREQIRETVDDTGHFTAHAGPALQGRSIFDRSICDALQACVMHSHTHEHRVPLDWRTGGRVIQRASQQWYIDVHALMPRLADALQKIRMVPEGARGRLSEAIAGRAAWCISRQRKWGVPIPVFAFTQQENPTQKQFLLDADVIEHVAHIFKQNGSAAWWSMGVSDLMPDSRKHLSDQLEKGTDTLDVWFDSGCMWASHDGPADVYIEGKDQFRGWFQSSLITAAICNNVPTRAILAHGFVLDGQGRKMSKSLGNVVDPDDVIASHGTDVLRMWAARGCVTDSSDIAMCIAQLDQVAAMHASFRNTLSYLLGNVGDLDMNGAFEMRPIDHWMVQSAQSMVNACEDAYRGFNLPQVLATLTDWVRDALSAFYISAVRDRLYVLHRSSRARRGAQHALRAALNAVVHVLDPIAPLLCAELRRHCPGDGWLVHKFGEYPRHWTPEFSAGMADAIEAAKCLRKQIQAFANSQSGVQLPQLAICLREPEGLDMQTLSQADLAEALGVACVSRHPFDLEHIGTVGPASIHKIPAQNRCLRCQQYHVRPEYVDGVCSLCQSVLDQYKSEETAFSAQAAAIHAQ